MYSLNLPNIRVSVKSLFKIKSNIYIPAFTQICRFVPKHDNNYVFDSKLTLSILAGFVYNKRIIITGNHGIGKSTTIEQVCNRLNWGCLRLNLDSFISRTELIGKHTIILNNGLQTIKFKYGIIPYAITKGLSLILDDYDACRPELKFVLNKLLEQNGELVIFEENKILKQNACFRIFATCNCLTESPKYIGTFKTNLAHLDRWDIILNHDISKYDNILKLKIEKLIKNNKLINNMIKLSVVLKRMCLKNLIENTLSLRSLISWAELCFVFNNYKVAFHYAFLNKCNLEERVLINKCFKQVFNIYLN